VTPPQVSDAKKRCEDMFSNSTAGPAIKRRAATRPKYQQRIDQFTADCATDAIAGITTSVEKVICGGLRD
jgi:hypothetical protein